MYQVSIPMSLYTHLTFVTKQIWLWHRKYEPHIHYAIFVYEPNIIHYICYNTTNCNNFFTYYYHVWANNKNASQMPNIYQIFKLVHVCIWHNYASLYTTYELIAMHSVTINNYIFTFYITGIMPWTNILTTYLCPTAYFLYSTYRPNITAHICKRNSKIKL